MERKKDTRNKIQLGGLIIKAGLDSEPKNTLLGILVSAKKNMENTPEKRSFYTNIGKNIFENEQSSAS